MIDNIKLSANNIYKKILKSLLLKTSDLFPYKLKEFTFSESEWIYFLSKDKKILEYNSKEKLGYGYRVSFDRLGKHKKKHKIIILFDSPTDFFKFINKEDEYNNIYNNFILLTTTYPEKKDQFVNTFSLLNQNNHTIKLLIEYTQFLIQNPEYLDYNREIPLGGGSKFLEINRRIFHKLWKLITFHPKKSINGFSPLIRIRLSESEPCTLFNYKISDLSIPVSEFIKLEIPIHNIYIIENKSTFLNFPIPKDSLVIHGEGYFYRKLIHSKNISSKNIYYFGDLDIDGLKIVSGMRKLFPGCKSFLMTKEIFQKYSQYCTTDKEKLHNVPNNLSPEERDLFDYLNSNKLNRLEQEKIPREEILNWMKCNNLL